MKTYTLFWLTGRKELVKGDTIAQAMTSSGYSNGSTRALDFFANGDRMHTHSWDSINKRWQQTQPTEHETISV
jgi:hypothetical protein